MGLYNLWAISARTHFIFVHNQRAADNQLPSRLSFYGKREVSYQRTARSVQAVIFSY